MARKSIKYLNNEEAQRYIEYLQAHELSCLSPDDGLRLPDITDRGSKHYFRKYSYFAAAIAADWYNLHANHEGITLGECIYAANTGLIYASFRYRRQQSTTPFRLFAKTDD